MPDYFSHSVIAEKIYERLDYKLKRKITSKSLDRLGAQGGDVLIAYSIRFERDIPGRKLHTIDPAELFSKLANGNFGYAAGFAAHYALDCTLHPVVYSYQRGSRSPLAHQTFEGDLGLYISRFYSIRRGIMPKDKVLSCTYGVYDSIKTILPEITVTGTERCLKRYFSFTRYNFKSKRQSYKCNFDFSSVAGLLEEAIDLGVKCINSLCFKEVDPALFNKSFLQR